MMQNFLRRTITFLFIPFFLILIIDYFLRDINSLYKEKYSQLIENKDFIEVLILGNSHANYGVDPNGFNNKYAYNLANVSQQIYFDKRLTMQAINRGMDKLKYVFISVGHHSLFTSSQGVRNIWSYYANGIKYKETNYALAIISPFLWGYTPKVALSLIKKRIINKIKYGDTQIINFDVEVGVNVRDVINKGFISYEGTNDKDFNEKKYLSIARSYKEPDINSERKDIIRDLEDFIYKLKSNKITPILFSIPTYIEYNKHLDSSIINRNRLDIKKICNKYNIEYWDYSNDERFSKSEFYNPDHLNKKGAKQFGRMLSHRLNGGSHSIIQ